MSIYSKLKKLAESRQPPRFSHSLLPIFLVEKDRQLWLVFDTDVGYLKVKAEPWSVHQKETPVDD